MQQATSQLSAPVSTNYGALTVIAARTTDGGYSINVFTGAVRHDALCDTFSDRAAYKNRYRLIAEAALAGHSVEQITQHIHGPAAAAVREAEQVVNTALAGLAHLGARRQVPATMAGAHLTNLTEPQRRILHAAAAQPDHTIQRGQNATVAQLKALARKGYLTLNTRGRRYQVVSATLTGRGLAEAQRGVAA